MIELDIKGLKKVQSNMGGKQKSLQQMRLEKIAVLAYKDILNSFKIEKNEDGKSWAKFKDSKTGRNVNKRPTKRGGTKLLQDTGRLRSSIRWKSGVGWAKVFTKVKYAKHHEKGKKRMNRSFMWVDNKVMKRIKDVLKRKITNVR
jgi:phage gpG-like protein